ncbi:hypothetical protein [uncultured Kordia sp.]|uniref:hypothetical protein n=1 Tax=uncultured Kordia sp. TaxID=507699 RepID=UPI002634EEFC|nr:hypothetical protein [uncultured Kordia sp.]
MKKSLRLLIYFTAIILLLPACKSDDDTSTSPIDSAGKLIFDGVEYAIAKAVSYTEARPSTQDYFFDITFLTANTEIGINEDFRGDGTVFSFSFINETNTFLSNGEYMIPTSSTENVFDIYFCELFIDYDFAPSLGSFSYDFSAQVGYYDVTQNATVLINRTESTYAIIGSGVTDDGRSFSLQYAGTLEVDPDSE